MAILASIAAFAASHPTAVAAVGDAIMISSNKKSTKESEEKYKEQSIKSKQSATAEQASLTQEQATLNSIITKENMKGY